MTKPSVETEIEKFIESNKAIYTPNYDEIRLEPSYGVYLYIKEDGGVTWGIHRADTRIFEDNSEPIPVSKVIDILKYISKNYVGLFTKLKSESENREQK